MSKVIAAQRVREMPVICLGQPKMMAPEVVVTQTGNPRKPPPKIDRSSYVGQLQQLSSSDGTIPARSHQHAVSVSNSFIGIFGALYALHRAWANYSYIMNSYSTYLDEIENAPSDEIEKLLSLKPGRNIEEAIEIYSQQKMVNHITENTVAPGIAGTSMALAIFISFSIVFPPAAIPLIAAAVITGIAGIAATSYATYKNRALLKEKLTKFKEKETVKELLKDKSKKFSKTPDFDKAHKKANLMDRSMRRSLDLYVILFATSSFNFLSRVFAIASTTFQNVALLAVTAFDAATNYFQRQKKLFKFQDILNEALIPKIFEKKFIFFGESVFSKYIKNNKKEIESKYGLTLEDNAASTINNLRYTDPDTFILIENDCIKSSLNKNFEQFCTSKKLEASKENFALFAQNEISKKIKSDVRQAGLSGTAGIGVSALLLGLTFPPLLVAAVAVTVAAAFIGPIATEIIAKKEAQKFVERTKKITDSPDEMREPSKELDDIALYKKLLASTITRSDSHDIEAPRPTPKAGFAEKLSKSRSTHASRRKGGKL